jgi:nitroreductase
MDFEDVVRARRMVRSFSSQVVDPHILDHCVELASRSPSAGKTQGWHLIVLEGDETDRFWRHAFAPERRDNFRWPRLFDAPVIAIACTDPTAYVRRYSESDKSKTGLGISVDNWPTPYWTIDASFSVMTLLLALENCGLGALFFAVFYGVEEVRHELGIPDDIEIIGALAIGYSDESVDEPGVSAARPRNSPSEIIHRGQW